MRGVSAQECAAQTQRLNVPKNRLLATFFIFLKLGLTSFGGPVAHLGFFRQEFVQKRQWLSDESYADLVALCQFLPGPASSQVGIALGYFRHGVWGALLAWAGFTLPSALVLILAALGIQHDSANIPDAVLLAVKAVALVVVAQALLAMAKTLCQDRPRRLIALAAAVLAWWVPALLGQLLAMGLAGFLGYAVLKPSAHPITSTGLRVPSHRSGLIWLVSLGLLLAVLPAWAHWSGAFWLTEVNLFFRTGCLVFGGGHVVLPLLQTAVVSPGLVSNEVFLTGYGLAQAVPGPLFTFAAFLGASMNQFPSGWLGGLIGLVAIFAPSLFLVMGALPFWEALRRQLVCQTVLAGINAGVVGLLASVLLTQTQTALSSHWEMLPWLGLMALWLLKFKWPAWSGVLVAVVGGVLVAGASKVLT